MQEQSLLQAAPQQTQSVEWIQGPRNVNINDIAEVNVPAGYQFVGREGASAILGRMGNPVPKNLIGLLASPSAKGGIVLKYSKIGFVKDSDKDQINATNMMAAIQRVIDRQNIRPPGRERHSSALPNGSLNHHTIPPPTNWNGPSKPRPERKSLSIIPSECLDVRVFWNWLPWSQMSPISISDP